MTKRILVINDTQEILELFRNLLEEEGYEVILSGVPLQKVTDVEQIHPDLIILDILFRQEKIGWQILEMLRMNRSTASIPIIICTAALKDTQEQEGYLNNQGIRIVYKPFDLDNLLDTVKSTLETASQPGSVQKEKNKP
jgi:DNA-binding response OmpR family regulator